MNPLNHVAIIMDGNGRWGLRHKNSRNQGHKAGLNTVEKIIQESVRQKIKHLTLYAFSTENWNRPKNEINYLFSLLENFLSKKIDELNKQNIKLNIIGIKKFSKKLNKLLNYSEKKTSKNTRLQINLALNYGSKFEILNAIKKLSINKDKINEKNWKNIKNSCELFFQKISQNKNLKTKENKQFELKQNKLIEDVEKFSGELVGLEKIFEEYILNNKLSSEKEKIFFDKIKTQLIKQGLKEKESQNKLNEMKSKFMSYDQKKSEVYKLNLRLDKLKKDLTQQENNLLFFNDKSKENKLLKTVYLKIKNQKLEIEKLIIEKNKLIK